MRHIDVASASGRHHFHVVCLLGAFRKVNPLAVVFVYILFWGGGGWGGGEATFEGKLTLPDRINPQFSSVSSATSAVSVVRDRSIG